MGKKWLLSVLFCINTLDIFPSHLISWVWFYTVTAFDACTFGMTESIFSWPSILSDLRNLAQTLHLKTYLMI